MSDKMLEILLRAVLKLLVGQDWAGKIQDTVAEANQPGLTGDEKKAIVLAALKETGAEFAVFILNLAIEIAVALLKAKLGEA